MAVITIAYSRVMFTFFEMADKTGTLGYCDMFALHDLGVAACAAELFASLQIRKVNLMVKNNFFKFHSSFQDSLVMAPFHQATFVGNFSPWF